MKTSLSVVIVAWNSAEYLARTLPALASELSPGDEVIIVDNDSSDDLESVVADNLPAATIVAMGSNAGYSSAVNHGAAVATGDLLVVLNPDAMPEPGFGAAIRRPATDGSPWAAWMALVVCHQNGRRVVNTNGNPVHFTGFSWAGGHGSEVPAATGDRTLPAAASGACLAVRLESWDRIGGFPADFFLYQEDTDLSLRIRSLGELIGIVEDAVVDHEYDFGRSGQKWLWLERNRWAMIIRNYPAALIAVLAPALIATELALIPVAARGGWLPQKLAAWGQVIRWLPRLLGERRRIQSVRALSARHFADILTPDLDSQYFPDFVRSSAARFLLRTYWRLAKSLLPG
ncbi:MAG: glycosyltransferase [Thermoleophilia bacterium]|nr:glycosyltransferase [Thermoleophilia bacterium]